MFSWVLLGLVALAALATTLVLTPWVMRLACAIGAVDRGGPRHVHGARTPRAGGLAILVPVLAVCALGVWGSAHPWAIELAGRERFFAATCAASALIALLGVVDDQRDMAPLLKLAGQCAITLLWLMWTGEPDTRVVSVPFLGALELTEWGAFALSALWMVLTINAVNVIDGLDGLAAGVSLIAVVALCPLLLMSQDGPPLLVLAALGGALLGFLRYNVHPASVFLGDTGSMLLGFLIAAMSIAGAQRRETLATLLVPLLALSLPYFEVAASMLRRWVHGAPVFAGDARHTHHRLLRRQFSHRKTVVVLWMVSALNGAAAGLAPMWPGLWALPYWLGLASLLVIAWLAGYLRLPGICVFLVRRRRVASLRSLLRYLLLVLAGKSRARLSFGELLELVRRESSLAMLAVTSADGMEVFGVASATPGGLLSSTAGPVDTVSIPLRDGGLRVHVVHMEQTPPEWHDLLNARELLGALFAGSTLENLRTLARTANDSADATADSNPGAAPSAASEPGVSPCPLPLAYSPVAANTNPQPISEVTVNAP